jgi:hypothetical protein
MAAPIFFGDLFGLGSGNTRPASVTGYDQPRRGRDMLADMIRAAQLDATAQVRAKANALIGDSYHP